MVMETFQGIKIFFNFFLSCFKIFTRKCKENLINCKYIESNKSLVAELKKEIIKRATQFQLEDKEKKNKKK